MTDTATPTHATAATPATPQDTAPAGLLAAFSDQLAQAVERVGNAVVRVEARRRYPSSGVVWTADGLILTADHALEREEDIIVGLPDGRTVGAKIAGRDSASDLAILRVEAQGLPAIERGPEPRVGHVALVVARPGQSLATSIGVVSATGGPARTWRGGRLEGIIWTDASLYPGFAGAPLVDTAGRMVGLITSQAGQGAGLAVPLAVAERVATSLQSHGRIKRGYLGVQSQGVAIPEALRTRAGLSQESGLLIVGVERGGPAERGGLLIGDVIVTLGGQPVASTDDLLSALGPDRVGQQTQLRVIRGGEAQDVAVTIGERE
jgi:S1-C subfamily serine protease